MKEVKGDVVSYLATAQKRAPSALRGDRKVVLVDRDAFDRSMALNHSNPFVRSHSLGAKQFSQFMKTS
jgi:hypothetical protein